MENRFIQTLNALGYEKHISPSTVAFLFNCSPELTDVLSYMINDVGLESYDDVLDAGDVKLFEEFEYTNFTLNCNNSFNEPLWKSRVEMLEKELQSLRVLQATLEKNSQLSQEENQRINLREKTMRDLMRDLTAKYHDIENHTISVSSQIDVSIFETLKSISVDEKSLLWMDEIETEVSDQLEKMKNVYESIKALSIDTFLNDAENICEKYFSQMKRQMELKLERIIIETQLENITKVSHDPKNIHTFDTEELEKEQNSLKENLYSSIARNYIINSLSFHFSKIVVKFNCDEIDSIRQCIVDMNATLNKLQNLLKESRKTVRSWSVHSRDLYLVVKSLETLIKQMDLATVIKTLDLSENNKVIQRSDRLLWILKELVGVETSLCSVDALEVALKERQLIKCPQFGVEIDQNVQEINGFITKFWDNEICVGAAKSHAQLLCSNVELVRLQQRIKESAGTLRNMINEIY